MKPVFMSRNIVITGRKKPENLFYALNHLSLAITACIPVENTTEVEYKFAELTFKVGKIIRSAKREFSFLYPRRFFHHRRGGDTFIFRRKRALAGLSVNIERKNEIYGNYKSSGKQEKYIHRRRVVFILIKRHDVIKLSTLLFFPTFKERPLPPRTSLWLAKEVVAWILLNGVVIRHSDG